MKFSPVSFRVPTKTKKALEKLASARGLSVSEFVLITVKDALKESFPEIQADEDRFQSKIVDAVKSVGLHKPEGLADLSLRESPNAVLYLPETWYASLSQVASALGAQKNKVLRTKMLGKHRLLNPARPDAHASRVFGHALKTFNRYVTGGAESINEIIFKVFNQRIKDGVLMVREINPIEMGSLSNRIPDKKIVAIFDLREY